MMAKPTLFSDNVTVQEGKMSVNRSLHSHASMSLMGVLGKVSGVIFHRELSRAGVIVMIVASSFSLIAVLDG